MGNTPNTMPYELRQFVKSMVVTTKAVTTEVEAVQDEELVKSVAEEIKREDPENAKEILENIVEESVNGNKKNRVHKKNSEESRGEV